MIIDVMTIINIACIEPLSAFCLLFSPIYFEIAKADPAPRPFPKPIRIINIGVTNPTPASASAPRPETHIASITLYKLEINNEITSGIDKFIKAFLGLPSIIPTLSFESLLNIN